MQANNQGRVSARRGRAASTQQTLQMLQVLPAQVTRQINTANLRLSVGRGSGVAHLHVIANHRTHAGYHTDK